MFQNIVFFCSFGGVQQASKITGPRKRPSQSPSMRLLGMLHIADPDGGFPKDRFCKLVCTLISFYHRLMGKEASSSSIVPSNLRNESYYMATDHETWNGSMLQKHMLPDLTGQNLHQRIGSEVKSPR